MAKNDVLEITAGDVVTASYVDEFARGGLKTPDQESYRNLLQRQDSSHQL